MRAIALIEGYLLGVQTRQDNEAKGCVIRLLCEQYSVTFTIGKICLKVKFGICFSLGRRIAEEKVEQYWQEWRFSIWWIAAVRPLTFRMPKAAVFTLFHIGQLWPLASQCHSGYQSSCQAYRARRNSSTLLLCCSRVCVSNSYYTYRTHISSHYKCQGRNHRSQSSHNRALVLLPYNYRICDYLYICPSHRTEMIVELPRRNGIDHYTMAHRLSIRQRLSVFDVQGHVEVETYQSSALGADASGQHNVDILKDLSRKSSSSHQVYVTATSPSLQSPTPHSVTLY